MQSEHRLAVVTFIMPVGSSPVLSRQKCKNAKVIIIALCVSMPLPSAIDEIKGILISKQDDFILINQG